MTPIRPITIAATLFLAVLYNVLNAATTHVFIIDGFKGYAGTAKASTTIKGPYFMGQNYAVKDGVTLFFDVNNSSKTNKIITDNGSAYGVLYQRNIIKITPANGVAVTNVKIATVNDYSQGFTDNDNNSLSRTGNIYEWKGSSTGPLKLRVMSDDANNNLGFTYVEVTYGNSMLPDEPDPGKPNDPDPVKPDEPETPKQIAPVQISPDNNFISPEQAITLSCATDGAVIYYTTDGSKPDKYSTVYSQPFTLSIPSGCKVWAIAVSPDGQTSESSRRYYLNTVTSIPDLFTNGSSSEPVTLNAQLQLVYKNGNTAYLLNTATPASEYLCVTDRNSYLNGINEGRTLPSIKCVTGYDGYTPVAILTERPTPASAIPLPQPTAVKLTSLSEPDLNRFVLIKDAQVTRRNTIVQNNFVMDLDDRFDVVTPELCNADANVKGFVALDNNGVLTIRPTSIELTKVNEPDTPDTPGDDKTSCSINTMCIGNGKVEIFKAYNSYTLTPEGLPLDMPASVDKGSVVYLYFPPVQGSSVASVVAGSTIVAGDSDQFSKTVYGPMLPLTVNSSLTVVVTFIASTGINDINSDSATCEVWYDLNGRGLPSRPTVPGIYLCRKGNNTTVIKVD